MEADILGLMHKPNKDWEERAEELCHPSLFPTACMIAGSVWDSLSDTEKERIKYKSELVQEWASYMMAGMMKGVLKYDTDAYGVEKWMAQLIGEGADQSNYQILLADAFRRGQV